MNPGVQFLLPRCSLLLEFQQFCLSILTLIDLNYSTRTCNNRQKTEINGRNMMILDNCIKEMETSAFIEIEIRMPGFASPS